MVFRSVKSLLDAASRDDIFAKPHLVVGGGSNTVFVRDFPGSLISFAADSVKLEQDKSYYYLEVDAGHNWHDLVQWSIKEGYYGLENLALIPGNAGAAPIQNIGAYGAEFSDFCHFVEFVDKQSLEIVRLSTAELKLSYRDSIFKRSLKHKVVITKVGLRLNKNWQANNQYAGLKGLDTPEAIYEQVICERRRKLPEPSRLPNAGSFFKNPIIDKAAAAELKQKFADIPLFSVDTRRVKTSAAWLIEQCGLKGYKFGGVGVYSGHALILVNHGQGTGEQLLMLIEKVIDGVQEKFNITLECEVQVV